MSNESHGSIIEKRDMSDCSNLMEISVVIMTAIGKLTFDSKVYIQLLSIVMRVLQI